MPIEPHGFEHATAGRSPAADRSSFCRYRDGKTVARDSGVTIVARRDGVVENVDSTRIVVKADKPSGARDTGVDIYNLVKYQRSNQNTCVNQRPIIVVGDQVKAGDVIADGPFD